MEFGFRAPWALAKASKQGVRNKFQTPANSHLIRFPIIAIIESEVSLVYRPLSAMVNPFE